MYWCGQRYKNSSLLTIITEVLYILGSSQSKSRDRKNTWMQQVMTGTDMMVLFGLAILHRKHSTMVFTNVNFCSVVCCNRFTEWAETGHVTGSGLSQERTKKETTCLLVPLDGPAHTEGTQTLAQHFLINPCPMLQISPKPNRLLPLLITTAY